jgi:hypothetical protein
LALFAHSAHAQWVIQESNTTANLSGIHNVASPGEPADADKNWNALSLPFVVGPDGRIGKLRTNAVKP